MTRSEIRDIEQLIQERAGIITTLSCSKDYPVDLVNDWGTTYPVVKTCSCDHTQVCRLCERRNDQGRFRVQRGIELTTESSYRYQNLWIPSTFRAEFVASSDTLVSVTNPQCAIWAGS